MTPTFLSRGIFYKQHFLFNTFIKVRCLKSIKVCLENSITIIKGFYIMDYINRITTVSMKVILFKNDNYIEMETHSLIKLNL